MKRALVLLSLSAQGAILAACSEDPTRGGKAPPATETRSATTRSAIPQEIHERASRSPVPVLAPAVSLERVTLVVDQGFYALNGVVNATLPDGRGSRATITVQGTRIVHVREAPGDVSTHAMRGGRGLYTVNEGIVTTTWIEGGTSYSVDVECSEAGDPRCQDEAFVIELTDRLAPVGGAR